jgi:signal transduction histidine kinase
MQTDFEEEMSALRQQVQALTEANRRLHDDLRMQQETVFVLRQERDTLQQRVSDYTSRLHSASVEATRALQSRDDFLAMMSHELRTPLHTVLGVTEMLLEAMYGAVNEQQRNALERVEVSGRHLLALINDVLDLSTIEAGTLHLSTGMVDIEAVCQASLQAIREMTREKRISVAFQMDYSVATIYADAERLQQILVNLLHNAAKFTPNGGKVGLDVRADVEAGYVSFVVWDSGVGIAPEDMERLFQPFVQLDSGLSRQYDGTGLGLVLVARLVEMHGGSVSVESQPGSGSRFTISLPIARSAEGVLPYAAGAVGQAAPAPADAPATDSNSRPLILVVDDNDTTIQLLSDYLAFHGYRVVTARDGSEAYEQVRVLQPALILMDIQMPVMDGVESIRRIRSQQPVAPTPIIVLTSVDTPHERERSLALGVNEYMRKPLHLKALLQRIADHLA